MDIRAVKTVSVKKDGTFEEAVVFVEPSSGSVYSDPTPHMTTSQIIDMANEAFENGISQILTI